jgi:hypothetical protein
MNDPVPYTCFIMSTQNVRILPGMPQKYVLVSVIDGGIETLCLWGNPEAQWHKDIVDEISSTGLTVTEVHGGGRILLEPGSRTAYLWGTSDRYGAAPAETVQSLLKEAFPGWELTSGEPPQK